MLFIQLVNYANHLIMLLLIKCSTGLERESLEQRQSDESDKLSLEDVMAIKTGLSDALIGK